MFPATIPVETVDYARLAQLNIPGGSIRSIALNAAFMAAAGDGPLTMRHILEAARLEYAKLERSLSQSETVGWA